MAVYLRWTSAVCVCVCVCVCVEVPESWEFVESRLAARGDGLGRHELLDAMGTLLNSCEKFLEI